MMEKLLKLLLLLTGTRTYSVQEISDRFEVTDRTVYRHLDAIENAGFLLARQNGRYRLETDNSNARNLEKLLHFSEEELYLLHRTLGEIAGTSPAKDRLIKKLQPLYDLKVLSLLKEDPFIENIKNLNQAIETRHQVVLRSYRSSHSRQITDLTVEPFAFTSDYAFIWCLDTDDRKNKQVKLSRMRHVELLPKPWQHQKGHRKPFTDALRIPSNQSIGTVTARLSLRAYHLLAEEFPLSMKHIVSENDTYFLEAQCLITEISAASYSACPAKQKCPAQNHFDRFKRKERKTFTG